MTFKLKKILALMLALFMVPGLSATAFAQTVLTPGTYTQTVPGHNGDLSVEVVLDANRIQSVTVTGHQETPGIADTPLGRIPQEIVENQSLAVDTIAGATVTSKAIIAAVAAAIESAGGDPEAFLTPAESEEDSSATAPIEMSTDVVVVGAGGAGLAAAAAAHQGGASVIVLEKLAAVGGSTARSGGGIAATGTRFQEELGIEDSAESWMALWQERQAIGQENDLYPDYEAVSKFMGDAVITTEWLVDYVGHAYGSVEGFGMDPVRRLHFPVMPTGGGGGVLINSLKTFIDAQEGITLLLESPATSLITDETGAVTGVLAQGPDGPLFIQAKKVILAAGGFAKNEEMLSRLVPEMAGTGATTTAGAGSDGDGINMALEVGAVLYEEPWVIGLGVVAYVPGTSSLMMDWSKVYVDAQGQRFTNEQVHYAIAANMVALADSPWAIVDSSEANAKLVEALEAGLETGQVAKGDSFEALAEQMGVPADAFVKTMSDYNQSAQTGTDALGKEAAYLLAYDSAPYYAVRLYPLTMGTFGGVKINGNYQVVREDGGVIPNLFAAGENANRLLYNQVYMSGSAVQYALTSGRIAGEQAALELQ